MSVSPLRARENHQSGAFDQEKMGKVIFPVSCTLIAQEQFNQAVAMLHSFWYDEVEKTFRQNNSYRSSLRPGSTSPLHCRRTFLSDWEMAGFDAALSGGISRGKRLCSGKCFVWHMRSAVPFYGLSDVCLFANRPGLLATS